MARRDLARPIDRQGEVPCVAPDRLADVRLPAEASAAVRARVMDAWQRGGERFEADSPTCNAEIDTPHVAEALTYRPRQR